MSKLVCVHTKNMLLPDPANAALLIEQTGKHAYPVLDGIPVLMANPSLYLAEMYYQYGSYCMKQELAAGKFSTPYQGIAFRQNAAVNLKEAVCTNMGLLKDMIRKTEPFFSKEELLKVAASNQFAEMEQVKAFHYLKRDWCGLPEGEDQLKTITDSISAIIKKFLPQNRNALFLGAGTGRITCELAPLFSHCYATDLALPMAAFYNQMMSGQSLSFFDITFSNILNNTHSSRSLCASASAANMPAADVRETAGKISYFIADACKLPMQDNSVDFIISAYFTDVLPFPKLFPEINRVLKKGGIFLHFGPLGNSFSSVQAMFTAEDIKAYLFKYGYNSVSEDVVNASHMNAAEKMFIVSFNNWVYAAQKTSDSFEENIAGLTENSVLGFGAAARFSVNGELGPHGEAATYNLYNTYKDKNYEGAEDVIRLLKIVDGKKTMAAIAAAYLGEQVAEENALLQIRSIVVFLVKEGILTVK